MEEPSHADAQGISGDQRGDHALPIRIPQGSVVL
jgi:hypothetical protein